MKNWNVRKAVVAREDMPEEHRLKQSLSWPHLVALGVGAIVGTGILTLIGVGAGKAGPAVILSFAIAGIICACAALAYAEVATMIPGPELGGILNLPAIFIIWVVAGLLIAGTRESATLNAVLVVIKILALALFIAVALPVFDAAHFEPFMPYGFPKSGAAGSEVGVMAAAA